MGNTGMAARIESMETLQSVSEAAGLAVACDFSDAELLPVTGAMPRPAADLQPVNVAWAAPRYRLGFDTPSAQIGDGLREWLVARLPITRS